MNHVVGSTSVGHVFLNHSAITDGILEFIAGVVIRPAGTAKQTGKLSEIFHLGKIARAHRVDGTVQDGSSTFQFILGYLLLALCHQLLCLSHHLLHALIAERCPWSILRNLLRKGIPLLLVSLTLCGKIQERIQFGEIYLHLLALLALGIGQVDAVVVGTVSVAIIVWLEFLATQLQGKEIGSCTCGHAVRFAHGDITQSGVDVQRSLIPGLCACARHHQWSVHQGSYPGCLQRSTVQTCHIARKLVGTIFDMLAEWHVDFYDISHLPVLLLQFYIGARLIALCHFLAVHLDGETLRSPVWYTEFQGEIALAFRNLDG